MKRLCNVARGLPLRGVPDLQGYPHDPSQQAGSPPRTKSRPAPAPVYPALDRRLPCSEAPRPGAWQAHGDAASGSPDRGGDYRYGLCGGLHTGDLRDYDQHLRGLDLQRLRHPRAARLVLHARRLDAALCVPEPRALGSARLRRGEVHLERPLWEGADLGLPSVHRYGRGGLHSRLVVEDPQSGKVGRDCLDQQAKRE